MKVALTRGIGGSWTGFVRSHEKTTCRESQWLNNFMQSWEIRSFQAGKSSNLPNKEHSCDHYLAFVRTATITSKWTRLKKSQKIFLLILSCIMPIQWTPMRMIKLYSLFWSGNMQSESFLHWHLLRGPVVKPGPWLKDSELSSPKLHMHIYIHTNI